MAYESAEPPQAELGMPRGPIATEGQGDLLLPPNPAGLAVPWYSRRASEHARATSVVRKVARRRGGPRTWHLTGTARLAE